VSGTSDSGGFNPPWFPRDGTMKSRDVPVWTPRWLVSLSGEP